ncbi:MAG TPA: hypothetical protein VHG28_04775, partial [Longimicrobiaceae bacterium]|nr:hypothetical protein [Longimicrobiaceae bacterium]
YAATVARREGDRETQTMAVLGLGNALYRQGLYARAGEVYRIALALARRHRLTELEGGTLHDLFVVSIATGQPLVAEGYARLALRAYGRGHPRIPGLAHDLAYSWLTRGHAARSLRVLDALLPGLPVAVHRMLALSLLGRAAGVCGNREVFERAWGAVWALRDEPTVQGGLAAALLELAYGASSLGERARAEHAAASALDLAGRRSEVDVVEKAGLLLDSLRGGGTGGDVPPADEASRVSELLADELVEALR